MPRPRFIKTVLTIATADPAVGAGVVKHTPDVVKTSLTPTPAAVLRCLNWRCAFLYPLGVPR
ncbi:MAG: hypothetical protein JWR32_1511 [Mycobacterium sp.]|jgi:hypothetical protein|nr:hypothetical protein [Mycobacterium sp.]